MKYRSIYSGPEVDQILSSIKNRLDNTEAAQIRTDVLTAQADVDASVVITTNSQIAASASANASAASATVAQNNAIQASISVVNAAASANAAAASATAAQAALTQPMAQASTSKFWANTGASINKMNDRVFVGGATINSGNQNGTGTQDWMESLRAYSTSISQNVTLSTIGQIAMAAGSRTSDSGLAGSMGCIAYEGVANNNNTTAIQTAYAGYFEAYRQAGAGITQTVEIDIINLGDTGIVYPGNMYPGNNMTSGLWVASGGGVTGAKGASVAVGIIANGAPFDKGIVIQAGAVTAYSGEAVAIGLGMQNALVWYDGSTNKLARIRCDATTASVGIVFSNNTLNFQDMAGNTAATIQTNGIINVKAGGAFYNAGNQVLGARINGWGTSTGGVRGPITASSTLPQVAAALAQFLTDMQSHGAFGV